MTDVSTAAPQPPTSSVLAKCKDWLKLILCLGVLLYIFMFTIELFHHGLPSDNEGSKDTLIMIGGGMIAMLKEVFGFVFGSSQGSQDKAMQLSALLPPKP